MKHRKTYFSCLKEKGSILIELLIALLIVGIFITSFLGYAVYCSRINSKSNKVLDSTYIASNEYERLKSLSIEQLAMEQQNESREIEDYLLKVDIQPYHYNISENKSIVDLLLKDTDGVLNCFLLTKGPPVFQEFQGVEELELQLNINDENILLVINDKVNGLFNSYEAHIQQDIALEINLYIQEVFDRHAVSFYVNNQTDKLVNIRIHKRPMQVSNIKIFIDKQVYLLNQQLQPIIIKNTTINTINTDTIQVYFLTTVELYDKKDLKLPLTIRSGIIKLTN